MQFKANLFIYFICLLIVGCTPVPDEMKNAERIMDAHPDSALNILRHLKPEKYTSNSNRALYGLLLFKALDKNDKPLQPDSILNFSINYYEKINDNSHLASGYYYKGRLNKKAQRFDEATNFNLKALELIKNNKDYELLGQIYFELGNICSLQKEYSEAIKKNRKSIEYFNKAHDTINASLNIIYIGRIYTMLKDYKKARECYAFALSQTSDSMLKGAAYQELGFFYTCNNQSDSARYFYRKSIKYPYRGTNFSIRYYVLADLLFDINQFDSAFQYASLSLKYPSSFFTQRECYRILTNVEYTWNNLPQMNIYMKHYQDYSDSVRVVESQTKSTVLEKLHSATQEANKTKKNMILILSALIFVILIFTISVIYLYKRNKIKRKQLNAFKQKLDIKQNFVIKRISKEMEESKAFKAYERKNASAVKRLKLDREVYTNTLHLDNWEDFNREMNHAFNNIIVSLNEVCPSITRKEIKWCCMHLLDIPHADRMLLLEVSSDSLYKLKQRLANKLNLKSTKDLSSFLKELTAIKD